MSWKKLLVSALLLAVSVCGIADAQAGTKRADKFKADVLYLCKEQASDPSTPGTGTAGLYCKTDGRWYLIDDAGSVIKVGDASLIEDADGDTKIQTEESADEDIIRFDVFGSQVGRIDTTGWIIGSLDTAGDGTLHVYSGSAGAVTASTDGDIFIIESDEARFGMSFLGDATSRQFILFGDTDDNNVGGFGYNHSNNALSITTGGSTRAAIFPVALVVNEIQNSTEFRVKGDSVSNLFRVNVASDNISMGASSGDASALLDMVSTTKGLGVPSMTGTQRDAISTPRDGLVVHNSTTDTIDARLNSSWESLATTSGSGEISCETVQASTSGTSIDFTSLPSSIRRITVIFDQVSLSGTNTLRVQIGDSGGLETSGYSGQMSDSPSGRVAWAGSAFDVLRSGSAGQNHSGTLRIVRITGNRWIANGLIFAEAVTGSDTVTAGSKSLTAELDRLSIIPSSSDTFDNGQINVCHEQ